MKWRNGKFWNLPLKWNPNEILLNTTKSIYMQIQLDFNIEHIW